MTEKKINGLNIRDYSDGLPTIMDAMKPYFISYSQKEAGFKTETKENVMHVDMSSLTYNLANKLKKDLVVQGIVTGKQNKK